MLVQLIMVVSYYLPLARDSVIPVPCFCVTVIQSQVIIARAQTSGWADKIVRLLHFDIDLQYSQLRKTHQEGNRF